MASDFDTEGSIVITLSFNTDMGHQQIAFDIFPFIRLLWCVPPSRLWAIVDLVHSAKAKIDYGACVFERVFRCTQNVSA